MSIIRSMAYLGAATCCAGLASFAPTEDLPTSAPEPTAIFESAQKKYARIDSYIARLTRREVVKGSRRPEEVILLKFREHPWSVYMKWIGKAGHSREGTYVRGQHQGKVHIRVAPGDIPFVPAGRRMALEPEGALMRSASPRPITDLGIGASLDRIGLVLAANRNGDHRPGRITPVGPERRPEFSRPVFGLEHSIPAGMDPLLPRGGSRTYYFHPRHELPTLLVTLDNLGGEIEYYRYDRLELSVKLDDQDFEPDLLFGKSKT